MMRKKLLVLLSLILVLGVFAGAKDLTGQEILDDLRYDAVFSGSGSAELALITENNKGVQRKSTIKVYLKSSGDTDKQFLEYIAPADVRGTKFLSVNETGKEDQMWLYMPALGRERRIASHMTQDSFMGTDFTYDEIGGNFASSAEYAAKRLADAKEQGLDCYVLELTKKDSAAENVLYSDIKMWVWKEESVPVRVEFYSAGGILAKTLTLSGFKRVEKDMIPHDVVMKDNQKGTRTLIEIITLTQEEVDDEIFTVRNLRR